VGPLPRIAALVLALAAGAAGACEVPGDGTSLRRALLKVKYLPETELWELQTRKSAPVHYVLSLDEPIVHEGRCYWPIDARTGEQLWQRFFATPGGEHVLVVAREGKLVPLEEWRKSAR
jgi:hypothetical protein